MPDDDVLLTPQPVTLEMKRGKPRSRVILNFRGEFEFLSNFPDAQVTLPAEWVSFFGDKAAYPVPNSTWPLKEIRNFDTVELPEMEFSSSEKAYYAWRTYSLEMREKLQKMTSGEAKEFANTNADYKKTWRAEFREDQRVRMIPMYWILHTQKFDLERNPELAHKLVNTGDATLIEGNTWGDIFFGFDFATGTGENLLGRIHMTNRDHLRVKLGMEPLLKKRILPDEVFQASWPFRTKA